MSQFMPVNEQKAAQLNERLGRTMFKTPGDFINIYNSGLVNKKHKDVIAFAKEIIETFKNVKEQNGRLTFITQQEIYLEEILNELHEWKSVVKIKRELRGLLSDETLGNDDVIAFTGTSGIYKPEGDELTKISSQRLFSRPVELEKAYNRWSSAKNDEKASSQEYRFKVSDFSNLNDQFINQLRANLPN